MNKEQVAPQASAAHEPSLVRFTEALTGNPDAKSADGIADMLLIFLSAGGTIAGVFVAAIVYLYLTASQDHSVSWMFLLLVSVGRRSSWLSRSDGNPQRQGSHRVGKPLG
jgi:hypothetical protein